MLEHGSSRPSQVYPVHWLQMTNASSSLFKERNIRNLPLMMWNANGKVSVEVHCFKPCGDIPSGFHPAGWQGIPLQKVIPHTKSALQPHCLLLCGPLANLPRMEYESGRSGVKIQLSWEREIRSGKNDDETLAHITWNYSNILMKHSESDAELGSPFQNGERILFVHCLSFMRCLNLCWQ
ncbi:hypothetical protein FF38_04480 [Lucilia cuprina]|uniref:Uncharacterized protein n=1 Tax=Lucilia cuprina TaxID=7375 RepID=A0A0L0CD21_LUCCU|nr:hypothetical protein FF38_04480 [Lucilia cuprina]